MAPKSDSTPTFDQAWQMLSFLREQKASSDQLQNLFGAGDLVAQMLRADLTKVDRAAFAALLAAAPTGQVLRSLTLPVDYHRTISAGVAAGGYDGYISDAITDANFSHQRTGLEPKVTIHLVKFPVVGTTAAREAALQAFGDLADMDDMLALGEQHPDLQRQFPIIFLGASWVRPDGDREVGYLSGDARSRSCRLDWAYPADRWNPNYVFAVRARK